VTRIVLSGYIEVADADIDDVRRELPAHVALTRGEPGCLVFEVTPRADIPGRFDVYEEFVDRAAFEAHQERTRQSRWAAVTLNVARHYEVSGD